MTDERLAGLARWYGDGTVVVADDVPGGGYSAELLFVRLGGEAVVVRLAPDDGMALFPDADLSAQAAVQDVAGAAGVPVAGPVVHEPDPSWLGRPFLVAPRVAGRHPGDAPALTPWVAELPASDQSRLQAGFLDALAAIHRIDPEPLVGRLRGTVDLAAELAWWEWYATWACEGVSPDPLIDLFAWCRDRLPSAPAAPASLLWGDVRLGNVVIGDDLQVVAVLDWEMATLGPAESDLAWLTALDAMTAHFVGDAPAGFARRDEVVARHEAALGRSMVDFEWHEAFAVARAAAVSVRTGIVAARRSGRPVPDPAAHPVVSHARTLISGS